MRYARAWLAAVAFVLLVGSSAASANAADLRVGLANEPDSVDPHFHDYGGNLALSLQIFEPLVHMDEHSNLSPGLATDWRSTDEHSWVFHLRPDIKFSNGDALTSEDVIFSLGRAGNIPGSPGGFGAYVRGITDVTAVDPHTVLIHTKGPVSLLPNFLALIGIVSHKAADGATTADYNSGKAAIGTGPYRLESWRRSDRTVLVRNDLYWGKRPEWDRVTFRYIANPAARVAALLANDVDIIDGVSVQDVDSLKRNSALRLRSAVSSNVIIFEPDVADRQPPFITGPDGQVLKQNPLSDKRVRQAIELAINRDVLKRRVMNDQADIANQIMTPGQFGYNPDIATSAYDPARSKALLADAGYKDGFKISFHCQGDRYAAGPELCQAVAQMLTRVGIRTEPVIMPHSVFIGHANKHEYSLFTGFLLVETGEPSSTLATTFTGPSATGSWGTINRGQYEDPAFDSLVNAGQNEMDADKREEIVRRAEKALADNDGFFPLFHPLNLEAMRVGFNHMPRADGYVFAADVTAESPAQ